MPEKSYTVWMVDDDIDDVFLAKSAAKQLESRVDLVSLYSGKELLEAIEATQSSELPDLVLLDLNMPGISGQEVLARRYQSSGKLTLVPFVVLSTSDSGAEVVNCYESGASGYVVKPSEFTDFVVVLSRIFDFWLLTNTSTRRAHQSASND
ncbi:response regulator [Gilvimarinus algae]|uniref:Response regulator n=1 Tax=Gilvimarinus algae TaxID=3058037 RepID=A0ABT8THR1_9GAMM|nr:response regulator [Gilvimarinus sp. SDUM040014]MDO3383641.1 response regulator [Gilvimarinus sp. SDUM040014]